MKLRFHRRRYRLRGLMLVVLAGCSPLLATVARAACVADEPQAYRETGFRAATPCTLRGAVVLSTPTLRARLEQGDVVLVDVLPAPRRPAGLGQGTLWAPPRRATIPGAVWLPNTGFGTLPVEEERYLRDNLSRLTAGDRERALVFFCERDCWMSWNAARRALSWGYRVVYWYPDGTDGWREAGLELVEAEPVVREQGH